MTSPALPTRMSAGVVVVSLLERNWKFLLLRAYRNWDFPKGLVEVGESPLEAAIREVREETTLDDIAFDWGTAYMDTGPYNKGKIARYYIARSTETHIELPVNPALGTPEHHEARWVEYERALTMVSARLLPVTHWAYAVVQQAVSRRESADSQVRVS